MANWCLFEGGGKKKWRWGKIAATGSTKVQKERGSRAYLLLTCYKLSCSTMAAECSEEEEEEWWDRQRVQPVCQNKRLFCLETLRQGGSSILALQLCVSQGFGFTGQTHTVEAFGKAGPRLGDLLVPNDAQAVSCYCWSAFCLQANVTVVPELVPYWRLILGEREKSGQYGSH